MEQELQPMLNTPLFAETPDSPKQPLTPTPPETTIAQSKTLMNCLRHGRPRLFLNAGGYAAMVDVTVALSLSEAVIREIVKKDKKSRFEISEQQPGFNGGPRLAVRCRQGHSVEVDDNEFEVVPQESMPLTV